MASPVADTYYCASAGTIFGGRGISAGAPLTGYRTGGRLFVDALAGSPTQRLSGIMSVAARTSIAAPKDDYIVGVFGPNYTYVDVAAQWPWINAGGDWIDSTGAAQGASAHFSFAANSVTSGSASYSTSITAGVQAAFARGRWNAYIVKTSASTRSIAAIHHTTLAAASIAVNYADSSTATLACRVCVSLLNGTAYTQIGDTESAIGSSAGSYAALEFEMPTKAVSSATLTIALSQHTSTAATVSGFLANPTANTATVEGGLSVNYIADSGIGTHWSVLFSQRYANGSVLSDFVIPIGTLNTNVFNVTNWDPGIYGGANDTTKLPTASGGVTVAGTNKWFYKQDTSANISLVNSSYSGDGFVPLESGLGALRIVTPGSAVADGGNGGGAGSTGSDLWALFPKAISGLTNEVYCRFSVRFAWSPATLAATKMYRDSGGASAHYTVPVGKWGVGAHHWTNFGGNNRVGGGNLGWSNRLAYTETPADLPAGGIAPAIHSLDMSPYGLQTNMPFGKDGGLGASFYPNQWYTVEVRIKLNTWVAGVGSADGVMQVWIGGKLDSTNTGWKYRDGAIDYVTATPKTTFFAPYREMGAIGLALNTYNGGVTPPDHDLVMFIGPMVAGTAQIGPLRSATTAPSWPFTVPASSTIGAISTNTLNDLTADGNEQFSLSKVLGTWGGASVVLQKTAGIVTDFLYVIFGGGHGDTGNDGVYGFRASTGLMETLLAPSAAVVARAFASAVSTDATNGETIANRPDSQHVYNNLHALHSDDSQGPAMFIVRSAAVGGSAGISGRAHRFDTTAKTWARYGSLNGSGLTRTQAAVIKDTLRHQFVHFPSDNLTDFYTLDYSLSNPTWSAGTQSARGGNWTDSFGAMGVYDPVRDLYIAGTQRGVGSNLQAIAGGSLTGSWTQLTFSGSGPTFDTLALQYRGANDTFVVIDTSSSPPTGVYVLTPPASSPLSNAWTWSRISFSGTSHFANNSSAPQWGARFQYLEALDALLVCPAAGFAMELWKF